MSTSQQQDNEVMLRSLEPNTSRLPLRKRIAPVLKWQPVETPEEHLSTKVLYPSPQTYPIEQIVEKKSLAEDNDNSSTNSSSSSSMNSLTRPTKKVKRGRPPLSKPPVEGKVEPPLQNTATRPAPALDIDTSVLYCICKRPYDVPRFMIACDKCDQWFHGECIQISEKQGEFIDLYFCEPCSKITGKKTSWKPECANPACSKAARIGTNQGHLSKYCTDNCGLTVARARITLAEQKKQFDTPDEVEQVVYNPLSRGKLSSFADLDDRARLTRVKDEKTYAKFIIAIGEHKAKLISLLIQHQKEDVCGYDSRLTWPDSLWEKVASVVEQKEDGHHLLLNDQEAPVMPQKGFTICQQARKCNKHLNWQKIKTYELEQERSEQFVILTMLERERQQIKARMKKRREEVDIVDFLENGTILHLK